MITVPVELGERSYDVLVGDGEAHKSLATIEELGPPTGGDA